MKVWADQVGDPSYKYEYSSKYYYKSLNFTPQTHELRLANATPSYDPKIVPTGGLLDLTYTSFASPWSSWVAKASKRPLRKSSLYFEQQS